MVILAILVQPNLENDRVQTPSDPSHCAVLFRGVQVLIQVIRVRKDFLYLLESNSALRIGSKQLALLYVEVESHSSITVIPQAAVFTSLYYLTCDSAYRQT